MAARPQMGPCSRHGGEYRIESLNRYGGMCRSCSRGCKNIVKCPGPCGKGFARSVLNKYSGMCSKCHTDNCLTEKIKQLEQENAELKKTLHNTISAYASFVMITQK